MIQTQAITKRFDRLQILKGIDIEVQDREIVAIVGPSGAGKTTLLQIVGTLDRPDSGHVFIDGVDPFTLGERRMAAFRNQHIGFVFQFHRLLPEFTALENVMIPALIAETLRQTGIPDKAERMPHELSGGEQQRVVIARALLNMPAIILADEPTGNLDPETGRHIVRLLHDICLSGTAVLMTTHNYDLVRRFPARVVKCEDGRLTNLDSADQAEKIDSPITH